MRVSVLDDDPGFSVHARLAKVFVDGDMLRNVVTADEEMGWALVYASDDRGRFLKSETEDSFMLGLRCGKVRIVLPESA